jgi:plastocyanin
MLKIINKGVCALAVAASFMATSVQAEDHTVLIMDNGYFPAVIYVVQGDNIVFTNNSGADHTMSGPEETWVSEAIPNEGTFVLSITEELAPTYSGPGLDGEVIEGSFSFDAPPLPE